MSNQKESTAVEINAMQAHAPKKIMNNSGKYKGIHD